MNISLRACALFSFSTAVVFFSGTEAQQQIPADLLKQIQQNQTNANSAQVSKFLRDHYQDSLGRYNIKTGRETEPDTTSDSLKQIAKKPDTLQAEKSPYENILRDVSINPDSILSKLTVYGYDVFSKTKPSTFAPTDFGSVPLDYPINVGDEINILLWGRINEEYKLKVGREGKINIPRIGPVAVAGLPFEAMQQNILDRVGSIEGVQASVSMGALRSIGVYIVGEVASPGYFTVSALSNVTNALFAAGGPTKRGSLRNIQLKRNGRLVATIDFYDFLMSGSDRTGLRLQSGDVILVPIVKSMAAVAGNVRRSALYELKGKMKLDEVLGLAGGITAAGWANRIQVERFERNEYRTVLDLDSSSGKLPSFEINDGDVVKVFPVLVKDRNAVYLSGNVLRAGKYQYREGMKVKDVLPDFECLLPECYFDYAVVLRKEPPSYLERIIAFNLKNAIETPSSADNIDLKQQDRIVVYNKDYFEPDRSVVIDGAVTVPGKYKLLDNMKIRDLILQAGGLREDASPSRGELYRRKMANERVITEKQDFCIECAMQDDPQHDMVLQRSDRIFIRSKKGWEEERKVTLKGQVMYPGSYVIFEGETMGDLLRRAGGFKDDAYLAAAIFTRKSVKALEQQRINDYSAQLQSDILKLSAEMAAKQQNEESEAIMAQQLALRDKITSKSAVGRVVVDLTSDKSYKDFALEDGDELFVPRNLNTVSVIGEVYNPSTFKFQDKAKVSRYIEMAGGLKETSDKKHIYVIKANGSIITNKMTRISSARLEPGDAIVVPERIRYTNPQKVFVDTADAIFKIATVLGTIISIIAAISLMQKQ